VRRRYSAASFRLTPRSFPNGALTLKTCAAALAALLTIGAAMGGCSPSAPAGGGEAGGADEGKFAGLGPEILKWRKDILASDALCKSQAEGEKCQGFEIACKAEREVSAQDQAAGITARVVAAMTWNGFDPKFKHGQSGMRAAEFAKGKAGWARTEHKPVNPGTCADL